MHARGPAHRAALPALPRMAERGDIQGLRGVAVLLVVLAHAGVPGLSGGFVGVDVFFVLSGYLISSILLHHATARGRVSLADFYARRARRILPASTLVLVVTAVVATLTSSFVRAEQVVEDVVWSAFLAANVHFGAQGTDYFASDLPPSPVQHFWSLAVEEQFYLVWPALLVVVLLAGVGGGSEDARLDMVRRRVRLLAVVVVLGCAASLWWSAASTAAEPAAAYFSTTARVWELGAGVLLALAGRHLPRIGPRAAAALGALGLVLLAFATLAFDERTPFPGLHALVPVLGTAALLAGGAAGPSAGGAARLLTAPSLRRVGDVSYSFYLWHWPFLVLGADLAGGDPGLLLDLALVLASYGAAVLTYRFVEDPLRRARPLARRPRATLVLWPAALVAVLATSAWSSAEIAATQTGLAAAAEAVDPSSLAPAQRVRRTSEDPLHHEVADALDLATLGAPVPALEIPLTGNNRDIWASDEACAAEPTESSSEVCPAGDTTSSASTTVVVLGDSHANMWLPALDRVGEDTGARILPIIKFGCVPVDVDVPAPAVDGAWTEGVYTECAQWRRWALEQVAEIRPDVVVVGAATSSVMLAEDGSSLAGPDERLAAWRSGTRALAEELGAVAGEVVLLGDPPYLPWTPAECLSERDATMATCEVAPDGSTRRMNAALRTGVQGLPGVRYADVVPMLCAEGRCPLVVGSTVVYRGHHHVTASFARKAADSFARRVGLVPDDEVTTR